MQELLNRIGVFTFIQILLECWNEIFIFLLLAMLINGIYSYKKSKFAVRAEIPMSKELIIFYITVMLYNMCDVLNNIFGGMETHGAGIIIRVSLFCYHAVDGFYNVFILQVLKIYMADRKNIPKLRKQFSFLQSLQILLFIMLLLAPFKNIFYQINEHNQYVYLWGHFLRQGTDLLTFVFIGIVVVFMRKKIRRPFRALVVTVDIFPLISCFCGFFISPSLCNSIIYIMALMVFLLYEHNKTKFIIKKMYELEKTKVLLAESRLSLEESNNRTLMAQIQPHFINNSLMALRARCVEYPEIYESITDFSLYLKSHFEALGDTKTISFEQEMTNIEAYLALEQQNYKDRLNIEYNIEFDDFSIPALSVQPLVENAVRHGIGTYDKGGTVQINSYRKDGKIIIEVIDDGSGKNNITPQQTKRRGIGIENVRARLHSMSSGTLEIISQEHGTTARITIEDTKIRGV